MSVYFERYAYPEQLFFESPDSQVRIIVVIPCFNEPAILSTLDSLNACEPVNKVEVMLIVNEAEAAETIVSENNRRTLREVAHWQATTKPWFRLLVHHLKMPDKVAGVGFARKAGMDEAARRFAAISQEKGVIACFDADSTCSPDYFTEIHNAYFDAAQQPVGSAVYFEHPFPKDPNHRNGIIQYELYLRYYVQALRLIGYPFAFHTVGSSMVVRTDMYQKIGGMNKRKAGEDFYFLHRLIPAGYFTDITTTTIYPSARVSQRVPFGTGKAMEKWQNARLQTYETYNLKSFTELGHLLKNLEPIFHNGDQAVENLPPAIKSFLAQDEFKNVLTRIKRHSTSQKQFIKNFFAYFDGFKVLKFLHFSRDHYYPNAPVLEEAITLASESWPKENFKQMDAEALLGVYRRKDKLL